MSWNRPDRIGPAPDEALLRKFDFNYVPHAFSEAFSTAC